MKWISKKKFKMIVKKVLSAGCGCFLVKCRKDTVPHKESKENG